MPSCFVLQNVLGRGTSEAVQIARVNYQLQEGTEVTALPFTPSLTPDLCVLKPNEEHYCL